MANEKKTYQGGCHCGQVRYEATTDLTPLIACNCSICAKDGAVLTFVPVAQFKLLSGEGALSDYQWGKKQIHHWFCKTCGIHSFAGGVHHGEEIRAVNVRCLDGLDVSTLKPTPYDGKSL